MVLAGLAVWLATASSIALAADGAAIVTTNDDGRTATVALPPAGGLVWMSNTGGALPVLTAADPERVLVQLHGTPLARAARQARALAPALAAQRQRAAAAIEQAVAASGARAVGAGQVILREYGVAFHGFAARIPVAAQARVLALPDVEAIYPDVRLQISLADSVPLIGAPSVWASSGTRGAGQRIAILDTGVDYTHADLGGCFGTGCKVVDGFDFVNGDGDPVDDHGHGTHVASIAAGSGTLNGVAPDASLLAYKVCDAGGNCDASDVIAGIERAVDPDNDSNPSDHVDVINLSLSGPGDADDPMSQAVDNATAAGVFVAVAAGNNGGLYFSVGSPGTARTALTVGATTKTDQLAGFSSRGPSAPDYGLKPEIVAPGVSICAAKATGTALAANCIDTTHIGLSGTSMATPHVAGGAALLKAARPSLSPAELKSLLVQNSLYLSGGALRVGAGRLNLPPAAAAFTAVDPAAVSFGLDDLSQTVWTPTVDITVTNLAGVLRSFSVASAGFLPSGASLTPMPSSFSLAPGQSQLVSLALSVDNTVVPTLPASPFAYDTSVVTVTSGAEVSHVPVAFLKVPHLQLLFDQVPSQVYVHNRGAFSTVLSPTSTTVDVLVPDGTYDVIATFANGTVVHEGIVVVSFTQHTMLSSEAVYTISFDPRDESNAPLPVNVQGFNITHRSSRNGTSVIGAGPYSLVFSSVSSAYDIGFGSMSLVGPKRYLVLDGSAGLSASHVYGNLPAALSPNVVHYHRRPSETGPFQLNTFFQLATSNSSFGIYSSQTWPGTDVQLYVSPAPFQPIPFYLQEQIANPMAQVLHASGYMQGGLAAGVADVFNFGDPSAPTYSTTTGELPLNLGPPYFSRRFNNQSGQVFWQQPYRSACLTFNTQGGDGPEAGPIPWLLKTGSTVVDAGTATQTALGCSLAPPYFPPLLVPDASYRFEIGALNYFVAGQAGSTRATAWFDTAAVDPNPPTIAGLELRAGGQLTDVTDPATPLTVTLTLTDAALDDVSIAYDNGAGYVALPVVPVGPGIYQATIASCQAGSVSLKVAATDTANNRLEEEFNPAYVCRPGACGNGVTDAGEACDDGNTVSGDGCNATCTSLETCGNGIPDFAGESCDDGGTANGDGCSSTCAVEPGWVCSGTPSVCTPQCGDGTILVPEACDDANLTSGDGCGPTCTVEAGWSCAGQPSVCTATCGDGLVVGPESCDDHNHTNGDGCSATCTTEPGWSCVGQPSTCTPICGDGVITGNEDCDDGNQVGGDCCPANCHLPASCASPGKSVLVVKDPAGTGSDKLLWKWLRGSTTATDVGTPTASTGYHLCVWDDGRFVYDAAAAAGANWRALAAPGSFKYLNAATNADGTALVLLKAGTGNGKILWKGKGANLSLPGHQLPASYFAQTSRVLVRLMRDDAASCWESVYTTNKKNALDGFKAKLP
jgi:cysteine-rich repeat protein